MTLQCNIDGRPKPSITWAYNNLTTVKTGRSSRFSLSTNGTLLTIRNVEQSDYGVYLCHPSNDFDTNQKIELVQTSSSGDSTDDKIGELLCWVILLS